MVAVRLLTVAVVVLLIVGEAACVVLHVVEGPWNEDFYRAYHLAQMALAIVVSLLIGKHAIERGADQGVLPGPWKKVLWLVPAGLAFSFVGDVVNSRLVDLSFLLEPQTLLSIPFFTVAHILYVIVFCALSNNPDTGVSVSRKTMGIGLFVWPLFGIGLWIAVIPSGADALIKYLSLFYAFVVMLMAVTSFWVFRAHGKRALPVPIGGVLFALSDGIIGYHLLRPGSYVIGIIIWTTYFSAQLLIMYSMVLVLKPKQSGLSGRDI